MFFIKAFWILLLIAVMAGFLFLGFVGVPVLQVPVSKVVSLP